MANKPHMTDPSLALAAGFDPKTGLPKKYNDNPSQLKEGVRRLIRIQDEQDAVNRYTWYNLPDITGQELERMLYYKGQICMFYNEALDKYFYLPFAPEGGIDVYGKPMGVHPVPLGSTNANDDGRVRELASWLSGIHLDVLYDIPKLEEMAFVDEAGNLSFNFNPANLSTKTAILRDYIPQISQTIIPRQQLNDALIDVESDCIPFLRTALLNATGISGVRISDAGEAPGIWAASQAMNAAALNGLKYIPITGTLEFQTLTEGSVAKAEEFLLTM